LYVQAAPVLTRAQVGAMAETDTAKRIRALNKKLAQIAKLKEKGGELTAEESQKVASEAQLLAELRALERGEEYNPEPEKEEPPVVEAAEIQEPKKEEPQTTPADEEVEPQTEAQAKPQLASLAPAEAEKKIKALKKKLGQIQKLKEKGGKLQPEEAEKVSAEAGFIMEVMELEISLLEPEAQKNAMGLQKKLEQISKLKKKSGQLSAPEREKISKEKAMKQELESILASRPVYREPKESNGTLKERPEGQEVVG